MQLILNRNINKIVDSVNEILLMQLTLNTHIAKPF
jgi:hypothetical protein